MAGSGKKRHSTGIVISMTVGLVVVGVMAAMLLFLFSGSGDRRILAAGNENAGSGTTYDTKDEAPVTETASEGSIRYTELLSLDDFGNEKWDEGILKRGDKYYRYKDNLQNYLFMGVDNDETVTKASDGLKGGQSDAMFLVVVDDDSKEIKVVTINRNTIVPVDVYDENGDFMLQMDAQICLAHGYGDGMKLSCMRSGEAVGRLFRNIPVSGYLALNMGGVPAVNDAVGGITLTPLQTIDWRDAGIKEGVELTLDGKQAYAYLRYRDVDEFASADKRLERQTQYITEFIKKINAEPSLAGKLISAGTEYIVASIDLARIAQTASGLSFSEEDVYSVPGETELKDGYERYNIDSEAMIDLILEVFYEEV